MTKEIIEWYTPDEKQPEPNTPVLAVLADGRFVCDLKWTGQVFIYPERNSMTWQVMKADNMRYWAAIPSGEQAGLIVVPNIVVGPQ